MRSEIEAERAISLYADTVKRICFLYMKNNSDTEDIFQNVFWKYVLHSVEFENQEHEKAWIIRVTINECKNILKSFFRTKTTVLDEIGEQPDIVKEDYSYVLDAVLGLQKKYKDVVYLFYYEGYSAVEIAKILSKNVNTVYTLLSRARLILKEKLGGGIFEK